MRMAEMTKTVRNLDVETFRTFRAKAVELGCTTGEALNEAMRLWVNARSRPRVTVRALAQAPPEAATVSHVDVATTAETG